MDPDNSLQDVIRCELCEVPVPQLNCYICHSNLCKTCDGEHLFDESKPYIIVPIKHRQSNSKCSIPKCRIHFNKLSLHCKQCDITVCEECTDKHNNHDLLDISKYLEIKNETLQEDIEELEQIYPLYQVIALSFPVQRADLQKNTN